MEKITLKTSKFIEKAKKIHGDTYDYSLVEYIFSKDKVKILCNIHGDFTQIASDHLRGCGCKKCSIIEHNNSKKIKREENFINRAKKIHGDKYDYSLVDYTNNNTKVTIVCPIHGEFKQNPFNHLAKHNCPTCSKKIKTEKTTKTNEQYIEKCNIIHNSTYDYSKTKYIHNKKEVIITCKIHGDFIKKAYQHTFGNGCNKCSEIERVKKVTKDTNWFIEKSIEKHGLLYNYNKTNYINSDKKVIITCKKHGDFEQRPACHLSGHGCVMCGCASHWKRTEYIKKAKGRICTFYIIRCFNEEEEFYKIGITVNTVKKRYNTAKSMPYNYEIISEVFGEAGVIWDMEKEQIRKLKEFHYTPEINFGGSTQECFTQYKIRD